MILLLLLLLLLLSLSQGPLAICGNSRCPQVVGGHSQDDGPWMM
jgi:hypothetical protein